MHHNFSTMTPSTPLHRSLHWAWLLAAALVLGYWCWYNGYPFFYPDTGAYMKGGFSGVPGSSRPLTYGLFLRHTSLKDSLLWVVYAQGILTALFVAKWMQYFSPKLTPGSFMGFIIFLTYCTHASYYVSFMLADCFTPIFYGCTILLLTVPMRRWQLFGVGLLGLVAMMMHYSNLMVGLALTGLLTLAMAFPKLRSWLSWKRIGLVFMLTISGWVGILLLHRISSGKATMMQASHVYTMARLHEVGILKQYLDKACAAGKTWNLCPYRDSLSENFLWDTQHSPLYLTGGWDANKDEYNAVLKDIAKQPKLVKRMLIESLNGGVKQFFNFKTEKLFVNEKGSMLHRMVLRHFPNEAYAFQYSLQNGKQEYLPLDGLNHRQLLFFFAALLVASLLVGSPKWKEAVPVEFRRAFFLLLLLLAINAIVSSTFSTVVPRYQGRVVWLFILSAGLASLWRLRLFVQENWSKLHENPS
jgi:hypothetical protein